MNLQGTTLGYGCQATQTICLVALTYEKTTSTLVICNHKSAYLIELYIIWCWHDRHPKAKASAASTLSLAQLEERKTVIAPVQATE